MKKAFLLTIAFILIMSLTNCVKADQLQMDNEWSISNGVCDIERDADQNYYCIEYDAKLKKYDKNHNMIFSKSYADYCSFLSITIDDNNNAYILARTDNTVFLDPENNINNLRNTIINSHIIKLDSNGNIIFDCNLDSEKDFGDLSGIKVYNNYIYVIGNKYFFKDFNRTVGSGNYYNYEVRANMFKLDLEGNIISEINLGDKTKQVQLYYYNDFATSGSGISSNSIKKDTTIIFKDNKFYTYKSVDGEIFLGLYSTDLEKIEFEEWGINSKINDITEKYDGNYVAVGTIDSSLLNPNQPAKHCPCIIDYSSNGTIVSYKIIEGDGTLISIKNKDNGYYGIIYLGEENVKEYNNSSTGYYIVRYDLDFNVQSTYPMNFKVVNLYDLDENERGIRVLNDQGSLFYFYTEFDYKANIINPENGGKVSLLEDREYYPNEEVALNVQEDEGYRLKEIQIVDKDGNQIELLDGNKFIMPESEVTITPIFKKLNNKIIVVSKDETEDVKFEIEDITEVEEGTLVKMYLTAVLGYEIENIEIVDEDETQIDYTETGTNEYTFIMPDSDVTITPNYRAITTSENDEEKDEDNNQDKPGIVETIKTEVTNLYERITNPSTGDKAFELAFAGVAGIIVLLIVKAKRKKSSTRKSNILY